MHCEGYNNVILCLLSLKCLKPARVTKSIFRKQLGNLGQENKNSDKLIYT